MKKLKLILLVILMVVLGGVLFIKFDTPAAAEFTDNVLRPIFGARAVVGVEQVFYNISDTIDRLTYNSNKANGPQFVEQDGVAIDGNLNLATIPVKNPLRPMKDEGVWLNKPLKIFPDKEAVAYTFVRPDVERPYAYVTLVQVDMKVVRMGAVAGIKQPGGPIGRPGPGIIPEDIIQSGKLVAAFDGGFQYRDGAYGMIVDNLTYLPLKKDTGTFVGYKDGTIKILNYTGQFLGNDAEFVRQNCPILINNGTIEVLDQVNRKLWGRTLTANMYTWRSGIGVTKEGNLIFAVGNNLVPETLAEALKMGGAENAIQLDINPYWVRFNFFNWNGSSYTTSTLAKNLEDGSKQYLHGYEKDFFYLYKK